MHAVVAGCDLFRCLAVVKEKPRNHRAAVYAKGRGRSENVTPNNGPDEMSQFMQRLRQTTPRKIILLPRLLAGIPLIVFSAMHFRNPEHFRDILIAGGVPMVEVNVWAASSAELLGGMLLLTGFLARIGGLIGVGTMVPAILATVRLANVPNAPMVPPLPLPIIVLLASVVVLVLGGGAGSVDAQRNQSGR
jgi:uncharacterized membrane protein YphA (DoxX/SURF4 family)